MHHDPVEETKEARRQRRGRQRQAAPGGFHDRLIKILAIGLPMATGAIVAFLVLQFAYTKSTALQVVPSNTAVAVLFPMLVSPVLFAEPLPVWLLLGSIPSFLAIGLLAYGERES